VAELFFADVQTGLGPFLAAYLASNGWNAGPVGYVLTFGGLMTVAMQAPAGAMIDAVHRKRALLASGLCVLVAGAILPMGHITGSLATILRLIALRKEKLDVSFWSFLKVGVVAMPIALLASLAGAIVMELCSHAS
jgi:Na+/H+ antiporter NhaD/arsenite permease-like protein